MGWNCPRCRSEVAASDVGEGVFACSCGCFVVDGSARRRLTGWLRIDEGLYRQLLREGGKGPSCPFCNDRLRTFAIKGVTVDGCGACHGLLLDRGELKRLTGREEPAPPTPPAAPAPVVVGVVGAVDDVAGDAPPLEGRVFIDPAIAAQNFLGTTPWAQLRQERQPGEALLGVELSNRYTLSTPVGAGHVRREHSGVAEQVVQLFTGGLLRSTYVIEDTRGNPCLTLSRSFRKLLFSQLEVRLFTNDSDGVVVGSVDAVFNMKGSTYELKEPSGRVFARLQRPLLSLWQFRLLGLDGEARGAIAKEWSGFATEYFTDGDDFAIDFGDIDAHHPWTWQERCVIAAAALVVDLDHFERKGRGNDSLFDLLR